MMPTSNGFAYKINERQITTKFGMLWRIKRIGAEICSHETTGAERFVISIIIVLVL